MKNKHCILFSISIICLNICAVVQTTNVITVKTNKPYAEIQPAM
jgi:hypothetical protein